MALAKHVITWLHSADADADAAERAFLTATHGGIPDDLPELSLGGPGPFKIAPLLVRAGFVASNGEGMRKVKEGAIKLDGERRWPTWPGSTRSTSRPCCRWAAASSPASSRDHRLRHAVCSHFTPL